MAFGPYFLLATLEGLVTAAVLALMALGLSLVFGVMRVVNVAHGEFYMLGAVLAWWFASLFGGHPAIGFLVALVLSPLVVAAIAFVAERLVLSRLKYEPEATIVATIGLLYIIQQLALTFYGPEARPVEAPFHYRMQLPWFGYSAYKLAVIGFSIIMMLATWFVLTRTKIGLVMRATQFDRETAQAFGIPVGRVYAGVFALGAGLAAVAAVLIVPIQQAHYLMGHDPLLLSFIVVIIGGLGSIEGSLLGALMVGLLGNYVAFIFPKLSLASNMILMMAILLWRPLGLRPAVGK